MNGPICHEHYRLDYLCEFHRLYDGLNQFDPVLDLLGSVRDPWPVGL
jgi:hypothetical protein